MSGIYLTGHKRPTPMQHPRSTREAFADERAIAVEHYVSNKPSHRAMRVLRRMVAILTRSKS